MRIVGGELSGRRFGGPRTGGTRPTSERVREAIASAIESRGGFDGLIVLDLFSGTGAMGFEALSRGAARATLVERDPRTSRSIASSARELGLSARCSILILDLRSPTSLDRVAEEGPFDRVFVDPPYADAALVPPLLEGLQSRRALADGCILAVEHASRHDLAPPRSFEEISHPRYGDTSVLLLVRASAATDVESST